jgi:putative endonuclease
MLKLLLQKKLQKITKAKQKQKPKPKFFAYILECKDKTLYVGSTNNLEKRLREHNHSKSGAHYTKIRRPVALKYSETFKTYAKSRKREGELKRLSRLEKLKLIKKVYNLA